MLKELLKKFPKLREKPKKKKALNKDELNVHYRALQFELNECLVVMMADLIKIDQYQNRAAEQRIRVNSVKFSKIAKEFRKVSVSLKKKDSTNAKG